MCTTHLRVNRQTRLGVSNNNFPIIEVQFRLIKAGRDWLNRQDLAGRLDGYSREEEIAVMRPSGTAGWQRCIGEYVQAQHLKTLQRCVYPNGVHIAFGI